MVKNMEWTIEEVREACELIKESNKFLKELKSLEEVSK